MKALEETRRKIEEKRNLLLERNAELTEINCRLDDVQKQIKNLKSLNTDDMQLESMRQTDNLRINFESEKVKFDFFKQVNILNNNFAISGRKFSNNQPIYNLVHSLIDISDRTGRALPKAYLYDCFTDTCPDDTNHQLIEKLKNFVHIDESEMITQAKVDEMCNKIGELKQTQMPRCILFENTNKKLLNSMINDKTIFLYRHGDNFLVLQVSTDNVCVVDKVHDVVNNLMCEQVLNELCKQMLREKSVSTIDKCSMEMLYQAFKLFKKDFIDTKEQEVHKKFLNEVKVAKSENVIESLIESQVTLLAELWDQVDEYTDEHESIRQDIDLFKDKFVERIELFLFDECENRRKMAQAKLKMDTSQSDSLEKEIVAKQNEINKLNSLLSKKNEQLTEKSREIDLKREQSSLLLESNDKQNKEILAEIELLRQDLVKKEQELKTIESKESEEREDKRADELRSQIKSQHVKIDELNKKKSALENKRDELRNSIETAIREKATLEKEQIENGEKRKYLEHELNELNRQSSKLDKLIQFVQAVYNQLLTSESLFRKRAELKSVLYSDISFIDLYTHLVNERELSQFKEPIVEQLAKENVYKQRELVVNCLDKILADPVLNNYRDSKSGHMVIELNAININYEEIEPLIMQHIEQEISKSELFALDSTSGKAILSIKDKNLKMKHLLGTNIINNSNDNNINQLLSIEFIMDLIYACMRRKFLIKNRDSLNVNNGHLSSKSQVKLASKWKNFETLGELNAQKVMQLLDINFASIRKCYMKTLKIIAGNNIYIQSRELRMGGVNMAIVAGNDVVLPIGAVIDTSGSACALNYESEQAHGYADT
ncbi:hypothetical protein BpHYR1_053708, partial [Brachionus plicatilis]